MPVGNEAGSSRTARAYKDSTDPVGAESSPALHSESGRSTRLASTELELQVKSALLLIVVLLVLGL